MADDEMLCESLGEQIHRARKEGAKSERERILGIIKKWRDKEGEFDEWKITPDEWVVLVDGLCAEIEQCSSEEHAHASKRRIEKE